MYFMSVWLHITCEVNHTVYFLIHFDERRRGKPRRGRILDKINQEHEGRKAKYSGTETDFTNISIFLISHIRTDLISLTFVDDQITSLLVGLSITHRSEQGITSMMAVPPIPLVGN